MAPQHDQVGRAYSLSLGNSSSRLHLDFKTKVQDEESQFNFNLKCAEKRGARYTRFRQRTSFTIMSQLAPLIWFIVK